MKTPRPQRDSDSHMEPMHTSDVFEIFAEQLIVVTSMDFDILT